MTSRRDPVIITIALVLFAAELAGLAFATTRVANLATSLADVASYALVTQEHAKAADFAALADDLVEIDRLSQKALVAAADPTVAAISEGVPVVGDYLGAARTMASATAGLAHAALPLSAVLPDIEPAKLVVDGTYNVDTLRALDTAVAGLGDQLALSRRQFASIPRENLDDRVSAVIDRLGSTVRDAETALAQAEPLLAVLPVLLDSDQPRTWFVALQNLAEARGTGGLLSAYTVLDVDNGVITLDEHGSDKAFETLTVPTDGLPDDLRETWTDFLPNWFDMNVSPHFPYTGQLIANGWKEQSGDDVDGVLAFGQGVVQYMLAATGEVTVDGNVLNSGNVMEFLTTGVYAAYPDAAEKDAVVGSLVALIFQRLQEGHFDIAGLMSATAGTTSDRIQAWSTDAATEKDIIAAGLGGILPDTYGPTVAVAVNNAAGNKLEQFLRVGVDYSLGACGVEDSEDPDSATTYDRAGTVTVTLTNEAPTSGLPAYVTPRLDIFDGEPVPPVGSNLETVSIYAPVDAVDNSYTLDGEQASVTGGYERGRPVYIFSVELEPGQTRVITIDWMEPTVGVEITDALRSTPVVLTQPSIIPTEVTTEPAAACDVG